MDAIKQAEIIYPLLLNCVKNKETITYKAVNNALGYKNNASGHAIRPGMDLIVLYCKEKKFPQLTSLIVNKNNGQPTSGYAYGEGENFSDEHEKCFQHRWEKILDYKEIWDRRFALRKMFNIKYGNSK